MTPGSDIGERGVHQQRDRNAKVRTAVLVCTMNEAECLPHVLPEIPDWVDEVVLVDGGSTDGTRELASALRPGIRLLRQPGKGKGDAIKYGVSESTADIIATLDADGQTDPRDLERLIEPLRQGFDLAKGTRLAQGKPASMSFHRWIGNKILAWTCNILHGTRYTDICSGYSAFWKEAFQRLRLRRDGFEMEQELLVNAAKARLKVAEVSVYDRGRIGGESKIYDVRQGLIDWWVVIRERFRR